MILIYSDGGIGQPSATERIRNLSAYRAGEVERCESVRIVGVHPNAEIVARDYEARGIPVEIGAYKGVAAEFAAAELAEAPKRTRRAKSEG